MGRPPLVDQIRAIICDLVAAGIEGGSWDGVCERWDLFRYKAMKKHWRENGPPVYLSVAHYLGLNNPPKKTPEASEQVPLAEPEHIAAFVDMLNRG